MSDDVGSPEVAVALALLAVDDPAAADDAQDLIRELTSACTAADPGCLPALLTEDARLTMPPGPFECRGLAAAARGLGQMLAQGHGYRLIETRARGKPALALCREDLSAGILHASGLLVLAPLLRATTIFGTKRPGRLRREARGS
jgi:hypothetical protein